MKFFVGLHQPSDARHFGRCCISVNRLRNRKGDFRVSDWIMDSGAFTEISTHGHYRGSVELYADQIRRWSQCGNLLSAVAQDWMCEPEIVDCTGLSVAEHQRLTVERYDQLIDCRPPVYIMPVLQGYEPQEYVDCLRLYGNRLAGGDWVGVGSVCKRNSDPRAILDVLRAIDEVRPDLKLHGFGVKRTALAHGTIRAMLWSADSMAWSAAARREGRNQNDWKEARSFCWEIERQEFQQPLFCSIPVDTR